MKKPVKLLITGGVLFITGVIILPVVLMALTIIPLLVAEPNIQFLIPGSIEINVEEVGRRYVWYDYKTIYEGKTYSKSEDVPDNLKISMHKKDSALELDFLGGHSMSVSSSSSARQSIGYFEIAEPGDYILSVQGETDSRVFSVGKTHFNFAGFFSLIFIGGPVCMLCAFASFVFVLIGIIKMVQEK